jgi:hypothetical protein
MLSPDKRILVWNIGVYAYTYIRNMMALTLKTNLYFTSLPITYYVLRLFKSKYTNHNDAAQQILEHIDIW